jgi:hypothetical protein
LGIKQKGSDERNQGAESIENSTDKANLIPLPNKED